VGTRRVPGLFWGVLWGLRFSPLQSCTYIRCLQIIISDALMDSVEELRAYHVQLGCEKTEIKNKLPEEA
jgi:hypothetical protein